MAQGAFQVVGFCQPLPVWVRLEQFFRGGIWNTGNHGDTGDTAVCLMALFDMSHAQQAPVLDARAQDLVLPSSAPVARLEIAAMNTDYAR